MINPWLVEAIFSSVRIPCTTAFPLRHRGHATRVEIQHRFDAVSGPGRGPTHPGIRQSTMPRHPSQHLLGTGFGLKHFKPPHGMWAGMGHEEGFSSPRQRSGGRPESRNFPGRAMSLPDSALLMW